MAAKRTWLLAMMMLIAVCAALWAAEAETGGERVEEVRPTHVLVIQKHPDMADAWQPLIDKVYYEKPGRTHYAVFAVPSTQASRLIQFDSTDEFARAAGKISVPAEPNIWKAVDTALTQAEALAARNEPVVLDLFARDAELPVPAGIRERLQALDKSGHFTLNLYRGYTQLPLLKTLESLPLRRAETKSAVSVFDQVVLTDIECDPLVAPARATTLRVRARVGRFAAEAVPRIDVSVRRPVLEGEPAFKITPESATLTVDDKVGKDGMYQAQATFKITFENLRKLSPGTTIKGQTEPTASLVGANKIRGIYSTELKTRAYPVNVDIAVRQTENAGQLAIPFVHGPELELTAPADKTLKLPPGAVGRVPITLSWRKAADGMKVRYAFKTDDPEHVRLALVGEKVQTLPQDARERVVTLTAVEDARKKAMAILVKPSRRGRYNCTMTLAPLTEALRVVTKEYSFSLDATTVIVADQEVEKVLWTKSAANDGRTFWTLKMDRLMRLSGDEASADCTVSLAADVDGYNAPDVLFLVDGKPAGRQIEWMQGKSYRVGIEAKVPADGARTPGPLTVLLTADQRHVLLRAEDVEEATEKLSLTFEPAVEPTVLGSAWYEEGRPEVELNEFQVTCGAVSQELVLRLQVVTPLPLTFEKTTAGGLQIEAMPKAEKPEEQTRLAVRTVPVKVDATNAAPGEQQVTLTLKSGTREFTSEPLTIKVSGFLVKPRLDPREESGGVAVLHSVDRPQLGKLSFGTVTVHRPRTKPHVRVRWMSAATESALYADQTRVTEEGLSLDPRFVAELAVGFTRAGNAAIRDLLGQAEQSAGAASLLGTLVIEGGDGTYVAAQDETNRLAIPIHATLHVPVVRWKTLGTVELSMRQKSESRYVLEWPKDLRYVKIERAELMAPGARLSARLPDGDARVAWLTASGPRETITLDGLDQKRLPPLVIEGEGVSQSGRIVFDSDSALVEIPAVPYRPAPLLSLPAILFILVLLGLAAFAYVKLKPQPSTESETAATAPAPEAAGGIFAAAPAAEPRAPESEPADEGEREREEKPAPEKRDFDIFGN